MCVVLFSVWISVSGIALNLLIILSRILLYGCMTLLSNCLLPVGWMCLSVNFIVCPFVFACLDYILVCCGCVGGHIATLYTVVYLCITFICVLWYNVYYEHKHCCFQYQGWYW